MAIFNQSAPSTGNQKSQPAINSLQRENARLRRENDQLKADIKRISGNPMPGPKVQMRRCIRCTRDLPDGPSYFPGYLEPESGDHAAEISRHLCIYCR